MLRVSLSARAEELRQELRCWLKDNPPPEGELRSLAEFEERGRAWQRKLAEARFIGVHWPEPYGGRGLSLVEEAVVLEELGRLGAPQILGLFGLTMVGPVLIAHGSEAQKSRYLAKILSGEEIWCQGFSEPGAGSDLASLSTAAVPQPDGGFKLSGQKVWTSFAHTAAWCFVLARTTPGSERHQGLSYLLVPMDASGVRIRPLLQMTGDAEFNEVFFDGVGVPATNIVGQQGEGWKIAITTLMYERVVLTFSRHLQSEKVARDLLNRATNATLVQSVADCVAESVAVRALAYEHLRSYRDGVLPGPEGSLDKLLWSESFQRLTSLALEAAGVTGGTAETDSTEVHRYLYSRGRTIAAGTSEIQRNIIAERLLNLRRGVGS